MSLTQKLSPLALATSLAIAGMSAPMVASATGELTGNLGVFSNYVWRGATQTNGDSAIQGGLDFAAGSFYAGTWVSNTAYGSPETDFYAGIAGETGGGIGWDVGIIRYAYLQADNLDWTELYISGSVGGFSLALNHSTDAIATGEDGTYISADYGFTVGEDAEIGLHIGNYSFDNAGGLEDYTDYAISLSKGPFSIMLSDTNLSTTEAANNNFENDADPTITVSYEIWSGNI